MDMDTTPVSLTRTVDSFHEIYSPRTVQSVNDHHVKVARVEGEHVWHVHEDADEFFLVLSGSFDLALRDGGGGVCDVHLDALDTFVVPAGTWHRPSSTGGVIMMVEPAGTSSTGDRHDEIPAHVDSTTGHAV